MYIKNVLPLSCAPQQVQYSKINVLITIKLPKIYSEYVKKEAVIE